ncbi:hypothetical protein [Bradyrhizobium sp. USDA 329]|uniref:hypothetical protein n=1 Tax=unclassified Bradyrhizobium TaxID=2631580 RepID=UPI003512548F
MKMLLFFPGSCCEDIALFRQPAEGPMAPLERCRWMNIEKRALLDHAERCRRVANDLAHSEAAQRLRAMADEYQARATRLNDEGVSSNPSRNSRSHFENNGDREG